jgi:antirestriction protein
MKMYIYIANLGKYNEGQLVGKWVELPITEEELNEVFAEIKLGYFDNDGNYHHGYFENGSFYEEFAIHDYDTDLEGWEIGESANILEISELVERINSLNEHDYDALKACLESTGDHIENCLDMIERGEYEFYHNKSLEDVAMELVDEGIFSIECLMDYIDFDKLARDLRVDGYDETENGVFRAY